METVGGRIVVATRWLEQDSQGHAGRATREGQRQGEGRPGKSHADGRHIVPDYSRADMSALKFLYFPESFYLYIFKVNV